MLVGYFILSWIICVNIRVVSDMSSDTRSYGLKRHPYIPHPQRLGTHSPSMTDVAPRILAAEASCAAAASSIAGPCMLCNAARP
jgi:hypothetical protein